MEKELISHNIYVYQEAIRNFFLSVPCLISCYLFTFLCHANSGQRFQLHCLEAGTYTCLEVLQQLPKCWATGNSCCHQSELQWLSTSVGNNLLSVSVQMWWFEHFHMKILFLILNIPVSKGEQHMAIVKWAMGGQGSPWLSMFPNNPVHRTEQINNFTVFMLLAPQGSL